MVLSAMIQIGFHIRFAVISAHLVFGWLGIPLALINNQHDYHSIFGWILLALAKNRLFKLQRTEQATFHEPLGESHASIFVLLAES